MSTVNFQVTLIFPKQRIPNCSWRTSLTIILGQDGDQNAPYMYKLVEGYKQKLNLLNIIWMDDYYLILDMTWNTDKMNMTYNQVPHPSTSMTESIMRHSSCTTIFSHSDDLTKEFPWLLIFINQRNWHFHMSFFTL